VVVGVDAVGVKLSCTVIHAPIEEVFRATTNDDHRRN
jgi:uncharacterized protein YndB with AHSA1/START domain